MFDFALLALGTGIIPYQETGELSINSNVVVYDMYYVNERYGELLCTTDLYRGQIDLGRFFDIAPY